MFNLTKQERQVILFLSSMTLMGITISYLTKVYSPIKIVSRFNQDIGKIDLNKADKETLMSVSGIGEKLAQRIIEYRKQKDGFKDIEELKNIKGISINKYEAIKERFWLE